MDEVHKRLGPGHKEVIYQMALRKELRERGIKSKKRKRSWLLGSRLKKRKARN